MRIKNLLVFLMFFVLIINVSAQDVDTLILVSNKNYPDMMVSAPVSEKFGIPIIITGGDSISEETMNVINGFSPKKIIIVGGPAVVSEDIENTLNKKYEVIRLWGVTRYGTAEAVAEYFWPEGSDEVMLVEDDMNFKDNDVLAQAKEEARDKLIPILLTPSMEMPANTLSEMNNLGVKRVSFIALKRGIRGRIKERLRSMNISIDEINETDREKIKRIIRRRISRRLNKTHTLIVIAAANFTHTVNAPNLPQARAFIVTGMDQIDDVVSAIEERNISRVMVTGKPDLAEKIADELKERTDVEIILIAKRGTKQRIISNNLSMKFRKEFREMFRRKFAERAKRLSKPIKILSNRANITLRRALNIVDYDSPKNARDALRRAENYCKNRNYSACIKKAINAVLTVRLFRYKKIVDNWTAVKEEIKDEVESLKEKVSELTELNKEFGGQMSKNMTVKERLKIIYEFKYRRKEKVKEILKEAKSIDDIIKSHISVKKKKQKGKQKKGENKNILKLNISTTTSTSLTIPSVNESKKDRGMHGGKFM